MRASLHIIGSMPSERRGSRGITTMLVLAFMGIFLLIMGTITSYAFEQSKYGRALYAREQALSIAEAGLEYYKWFLARTPTAVQTGAGIISPYTYTVSDPEGGELGSTQITATPTLQCGRVQWIDLTSRATSNLNTGFPRTVSVRYMQPSVAQYSNLWNSPSWYTSADSIVGPVRSNKGIHMDGTSNSTMVSAASTWTCIPVFGCDPQASKPGVFGVGTNQALWKWGPPDISSVDFAGMTTNLDTLKGYAQSSGVYLSGTANYVAGAQQGSSYLSVGGTEQKGYRLVFNNDGSMDVYRVTDTTSSWAWRYEIQDWHPDYDIIKSSTYMNTFTPPSGCALVNVQATAWLEGEVGGKYTVVVADPSAGFAPDALLKGNISYTASDGSVGLTVISEHSVRLPLNSPNDLAIRGVFVASKDSGYFGRDYYDNGTYGHSVPSAYVSDIVRNSITVTGSIVSAGVPITQWGDQNNGGGFNSSIWNFDQLLAFQSPPFTPVASSDYSFALWREQ